MTILWPVGSIYVGNYRGPASFDGCFFGMMCEGGARFLGNVPAFEIA